MKNRLNWLLSLLVLLSMLLAACGGAAPAENVVVEEEPAVEEMEEPEEMEEEEAPAEVEEAPAELTDADLDAAFGAFLAGMEAYNTIGLDALNTMLAEEPPFLLDVRSPDEVASSGHIEGSVLIPLRELGENTDKLPSFDTTIVSYCGSGWRCTIALTALEALGWENVLGLKGNSYGGWVEAGYAVIEGIEPDAAVLDAAQPDPVMLAHFETVMRAIPEGWGVITAETLNTELIENPDLALLDTRRAEELAEKGVIDAPNNTHIALEDFIADKAMWPADKDAPVVVYCGSGHRSTIAMTILWSYGYTDVRSLKGGFGGWVEAGYPSIEFAAP